MEMSYFDLLNRLYEDVKGDETIPSSAKEEILNGIEALLPKLWRYSA